MRTMKKRPHFADINTLFEKLLAVILRSVGGEESCVKAGFFAVVQGDIMGEHCIVNFTVNAGCSYE